MNPRELKKLLTEVKAGKISISGALNRLKMFPHEDLGFAILDHHRHLRQGFPEVIFCEGKNDHQILALLKHSMDVHSKVLATRVKRSTFEEIMKEFPHARYNEIGKTVVLINQIQKKIVLKGKILIITAGTSDINVAEEARETALILGSRVDTLYDVGVAGIHRFLEKRNRLDRARVLIVLAGMDGVLPSVVGGLTDKPIIAVPTSHGYGTSFNGIAALLTMLNACSPGIGVMNVNNGFGAGVLAHRINILK